MEGNLTILLLFIFEKDGNFGVWDADFSASALFETGVWVTTVLTVALGPYPREFDFHLIPSLQASLGLFI